MGEIYKDRFEELVKWINVSSIADLEKVLGLGDGTIRKVTKEPPSGKILIRISENFPEVNIGWLLTGNGPILINGYKDKNTAPLKVADVGESCNLCKEKDETIRNLNQMIKLLNSQLTNTNAAKPAAKPYKQTTR